MSIDQLNLEVIAERPIVRKDQTSEIDIAIDLATSKTVGAQPATYALNLCIVIDRSGSMSGEKIEQAKSSCLEIYDSLNPSDRLTVLAFDTNVVCVVNPQTPRNLIKERIQALAPGGSTDLAKGWYLGLLELQTYATDQHINRLVLLSDGQANQGEQKPSVLGAESSRARDELGITTSTIGIGKDFQEDILAALAHESGGRFWFIGEARIEDIIKEEFSGALSVFLERPRIEVRMPSGVSVIREFSDLPKTSNQYRIRPIKANDRFCFALRLRVDPAKVEGDKLPIGATLYDGAGVVMQVETALNLGTLEEYAQSTEDPRVATIVKKFLAATSDEKIVEQMDAGNVTTMLKMLQAQADLMKDLESKLAGSTTISWEAMEAMTAQERAEAEAEAERRRQQREHELARLRMEIQENEGLIAVGELIDLIQGLGRTEMVSDLIIYRRKMHKHRGMRNIDWGDRGSIDDWAAERLLREASGIAAQLIDEYPSLREELTTIRGRIDEQLAHFS